MSKFQLHATSLESLARCGIAFERRSILGEKTPPSARMLIGTAVDRSVRKNLTRKMETGSLAPVEEIQEEARDQLVIEWQAGVRLTEEDQEDGAVSRDHALDVSVGLAGFHHGNAAPLIEPVHVARKWVLDIEGLPLQLAGEIDIQEQTTIRDTKTSGKSPVKTLADTSLQLSAYALAVERIDGALPEKVVLDYLVRTPKRGDQKLVQLSSSRTQADLRPLLERIEAMSRIIESGLFTPAPLDSWWCSAKYCAYHSTCRFAAHPVTVAVKESD